MAEKSIQQQIEEMQLEAAKLNLEELRESIAERKANKEVKARQNKQRQTQLLNDLRNRNLIAAGCNHRQGASPADPYNGKGASALNVASMPDGFTRLVMCGICRLRVFSPHPRNGGTKPRQGETPAQAKARVEKYKEELAAFNKLVEHSKDKLTAEASQMMDCGVTIVTTNEETGAPVLRDRPCDSYPQV